MSDLSAPLIRRRLAAPATAPASPVGDPDTIAWWRTASALARATLHDTIPCKILVCALEGAGLCKVLELSAPVDAPRWYVRLQTFARLAGLRLAKVLEAPLDFGSDIPDDLADRIRDGRPLEECFWAFFDSGHPDFREIYGRPSSSLQGKAPVHRLQRAQACAEAVALSLGRSLIGQSEAVEALQRMAFATCLRDENAGSCPTALFLGPPGVGKTLAARTYALALSEALEDENYVEVCVLEMTQYTQWASPVELFGDATRVGLLGHALTRHPRTIFLLNELEKAHRKVLEGFLPVLDQGFLANGTGEPMDARLATFIFTTNLGAEWWDRPASPEEGAFTVDPMELLRLAEKPDEKAEWHKTPIPKELLSRLAKGAVVLFGRPLGHHLLAKLIQGGEVR